jgi:hypothetical protein
VLNRMEKIKPLIAGAFGAWLVFLLIAVSSGFLREALLAPWLGARLAHQAGSIAVSLLIAAVIIRFVRVMRPFPSLALGIGAVWVAMTLSFEFGVFHFLLGHPMADLVADYDLGAGRLWLLVLFTELMTPWLAAVANRSPRSFPANKPREDTSTRSAPLADEYRRDIGHEEIANLPIKRYEGEVRLVNSLPALAEAMRDIRQERVLGFDTETRPAFNKGESYPPCLVQIATANRVYLLQLPQLDCSSELAEIMANPGIIKAGVALAGDITQLRKLYPLEEAGVVDLGQIARRHGNKQTGLRNLTALFLGWRMAKGARTTNWAAPRLSQAQIGYAATDAWASRELYLRFGKLGLIGQDGD